MVIRPDEMSEILKTSGEVIDAVGGGTVAAGIASSSPQCVNNWRRSGRFPPGTFLVFSARLKELGKRAPAALWRMKASPLVAYAGDV